MTRVDIDFNMTAHPLSGDLSTKRGSSAIVQALKNIVLTNYYERGFNIELGTNTRYSLFENVGVLEAQTLKQNIVRAVNNYEPNVEIIDVYMELVDDNALRATIIYTEGNDPKERSVNVTLDRVR